MIPSPGLMLTRYAAAIETALSQHKLTEKEHIFIGLCKVGDLLKPELPKGDYNRAVEMLNSKTTVDEVKGFINLLATRSWEGDQKERLEEIASIKLEKIGG